MSRVGGARRPLTSPLFPAKAGTQAFYRKTLGCRKNLDPRFRGGERRTWSYAVTADGAPSVELAWPVVSVSWLSMLLAALYPPAP
jgi:hypothetical protein